MSNTKPTLTPLYAAAAVANVCDHPLVKLQSTHYMWNNLETRFEMNDHYEVIFIALRIDKFEFEDLKVSPNSINSRIIRP